MVEPVSATPRAVTAGTREAALASVERAIREADPLAFPVPARIVRRVIRESIDLPALAGRAPHRKSFIVSAAQARGSVHNDELGLEPDAPLPETMILLARPEEHELERMRGDELCEHYRRLHFHARVHFALEDMRLRGDLDDRAVRERIERIGQAPFDEIRTVLGEEAYLVPPVSAVSVYVEFAAVFLELRYFAPELLGSYFPSLDDLARVEGILVQDVDPDALLQMTAEVESDEILAENGEHPRRDGRSNSTVRRAVRSPRSVKRLLREADAAAARGNDVRASVLRSRASEGETAAVEGELPATQRRVSAAAVDVGRLLERLRRALALKPASIEAWRELLTVLAPRAAQGFWNPSRRLLYDLQKVCLDIERDSYVVDLAAWLRSFGRRPLKRPLPRQREARVSKHLRTASARLPKLKISAGQREHLGILLREAAVLAESRLRDRLRPVLRQTLVEVGFLPLSAPERVSFHKIVEELLDRVVEGGYFTMGDIRDAIARNNLKLDDVGDPLEVLVGDRLLRADRRLADALDGVYQRGAFYLRWLQRLSSVAFGTPGGRFLTLYAVIPFGGAYVAVAGTDHLVAEIRHLVRGATSTATEAAGAAHVHHTHWTYPYVYIPLGLLILGLMHSALIRSAIGRGLRGIGRGLYQLFVVFPRRLAEAIHLERFLRSPPVEFVRRRLLTAFLLTVVYWWLLPALDVYERPQVSVAAVVFCALVVLFNTRAGRDIGELTAERVQLTWHRIRVHFFVALFDLVMDSFKRVLEWIERILYEVDEWLRFKSGETGTTLAVKAGLGLVWSIARFFIRFFVTVLIEPQINPIKHFPVVTVSHKVIAPLVFPPLHDSLVPIFGGVLGNSITTTTVFLIPGAVGFLVWELRGNWRLYAANRYRVLRPVPVGSHGETLPRLLRRGLHSGTLPRLFARLRRAVRRADASRRLRDLVSYYARLHHVELDVRRFFDRELLAFLSESTAFEGVQFQTGRIEAGANSLRVEVRMAEPGDDLFWFAFEEQSGRIVAGFWKSPNLERLTPRQRNVLGNLLVGFYRIAGADLVREQIAACLGPDAEPYDITENGLVLLPTGSRSRQVTYHLDEFPVIEPRDTSGEVTQGPSVDAESLVFSRTRTNWQEWVNAWNREESGDPFPELGPRRLGRTPTLPVE